MFLDMGGARSTTAPDEGSCTVPGYLAGGGGLFDTPSFRWLVAAIKACCGLDHNGATVVTSIKAALDSSLGRTEENGVGIDKPGQLPTIVTLESDWDPLYFIEQQGYEGPDCLPGVLTLSGTANNTQMLPCRQYLRQTWPYAGEVVLEALVEWIKAVLSAPRNNPPTINSRSTLTIHDDRVNPLPKRKILTFLQEGYLTARTSKLRPLTATNHQKQYAFYYNLFQTYDPFSSVSAPSTRTARLLRHSPGSPRLFARLQGPTLGTASQMLHESSHHGGWG